MSQTTQDETTQGTKETGKRETTAGLRTPGHVSLFQIIAERLSAEDFVAVHNAHLAQEAKARLDGVRHASSFVDSRRIFRDIFRATCPEKRAQISELPTKELCLKGTGSVSMIAAEPAAPETENVITVNRPLSALERKMFHASGKARPLTTAESDEEISNELSKLIEQEQEEVRRREAFTTWATTTAEVLLADMMKEGTEGEALWTDAVQVQAFPEDTSRKLVFIRSSTAHLIRTDPRTPIVKHDFRANDFPVKYDHPNMVRDGKNQRIIRSNRFSENQKVVAIRSEGKVTDLLKAGSPYREEFYVKVLSYEEGMVFKGYFVVDGREDATVAPPRYFIARGGAIVPITAAEHQSKLSASYKQAAK